MSMQDPISDMLTRIRNAQRAHHADVSMPGSKMKTALCKLLQSEGYIGGYTQSEGKKPELTIRLKYHEGRPVIEEIERISRPGLRIYKKADDLPQIRGGLGVSIISTCNGLMTDRDARNAGVGGELVCTVF